MAKVSPDKGYQTLKSELAEGTLRQVYIFHGEESYLKEYYLNAVKAALIPAGFEEFNYHRLDGKSLSMTELSDAVEALPMMSDRTLTVVTDCDLFRLAEGARNSLISMLEDVPPYCCLIFVYDLLEYKPNKTYKKLYAALDKYAQAVDFRIQSKSDLINWIRRRFRALKKDIDAPVAEYLIFTCGSQMTGLIPEIEKLGAYASGRSITVEDIDAVTEPVLDAVVFNMTNAITRGNYNEASEILGRLLKKQEEPIMLLAVIGKELRRLYTARLALDEGLGKAWLMERWGMRSDYPARLLMDAAGRTTRNWCENSLRLCQRLDCRLKSEKGIDDTGELKLFLMELAQKR